MRAERGYPLCTITPKAEASILRGHPWVYDAEILSLDGEPDNGAVVDVVSRKGRYLGTGFYSEHSKIRVRLLSRNTNDRFDEAFWRRKLQWAWEYRKSVMSPEDLDACRIIFGEADAFPGLTVDKFHDLLSVQVLSVGMECIQNLLLPALVELLRSDGQNIRGVYLRNDVALREKEGLPQNKGWFPLPGEASPDSAVTEITENGVRYLVDVENGQKTGFFLDQKYNRLAVARLARGADGAGLLHPHRFLCPERRQGRGKARHRRGRVRVRGGNGPGERGTQRPGRGDDLHRRQRL